MKTKLKKFLASFAACAMLITQLPALNALAQNEAVTISVNDSGAPSEASGTGWTYDESTNTLTLSYGYSFTIDGTCKAIVNNAGTILGGTFENTVNNTGNGDKAANATCIIENGTFNGTVNNYNGWDTCIINGGVFNGYVETGNHSTVNGGTFNGEYKDVWGNATKGGTFVVGFETNGGTWADDYSAPEKYTYSASETTALPTAENISNGNLTFYGWYLEEDFSGVLQKEIEANTKGKLTYYARFISENQTWKYAASKAVENTDYAVDENGNYTVYTAKGLAKIASIVNGGDNLFGKTVMLANDINLLDGGVETYGKDTVNDINSWIPMSSFGGTFDGNGKKISNLYVLTKDEDAGLFNSLWGTVKNLEIASGNIAMNLTGKAERHAGAICARTGGMIENCINRAEVYVNSDKEARVYFGGIAGYMTTVSDFDGFDYPTVSKCINYGTVSALSSKNAQMSGGGIVGYHSSGRNNINYVARSTFIDECENYGAVKSKNWAGGITGVADAIVSSNMTATVLNCKNSGTVAANHAGGIIGSNNYGYVYNCYNTASASVSGSTNAGGIVGINYYSAATVANCYSRGKILTGTNMGGVAGRAYAGSISYCYYEKDTATDAVGYINTKKANVSNCAAFDGVKFTDGTEIYGTGYLLNALNLWVSEKNSADYLGWVSDTDSYPKFKTRIKIKKEDKTHVYDGNVYDVSNMFTVDDTATVKYVLLNTGTGAGTLEENLLTITKAGTFDIKITADSEIYSAAEKTATLTVKKGTCDITFPTASDITYGKTLEESKLSGGSDFGTFAWADKTIMPKVQNEGFDVVFTPNNNDLYEYDDKQLTKKVNITVNPLSITVRWGEINFVYDGNQKEMKAEITNVISGDTINLDITGNKYTDATDGEYTAAINGVDNSNYTTIGSDNLACVWYIRKKEITNDNTNIVLDELTYNADEQTQTPKSITVDGITLNKDDYEISDNKQTDVKADGNYTLKITGKGNFLGTAAFEYNIMPAEPKENADKKTTAKVSKNKTLANAKITEGEILGVDGNAISGTFAWVDDTKTITEKTTAKMIFTPESKNYKSITVDVDVDLYSSGGSGLINTNGSGSTTTYTVTFETNGADKIQAVKVAKNAKVSEPTEPVKDGYIFDGWYTDAKFTEKYDFDSNVVKSFTLYAKWTEDKKEPDDDKKDDNNKPSDGDTWKNPFDDVNENDWFFEYVKNANESGLMSGISNNMFAPDEIITRGMFVTVLYRMEGEPETESSMPFSDVNANMYYADAVNWAAKNNIVAGYTETEFAPDDNITREQIAAIMLRYAQFKGYDEDFRGGYGGSLNYADTEEIFDYAKEGVAYCTASGIMLGKENNMFAPKDNATRAEIAAIICRFIELNK